MSRLSLSATIVPLENTTATMERMLELFARVRKMNKSCFVKPQMFTFWKDMSEMICQST